MNTETKSLTVPEIDVSKKPRFKFLHKLSQESKIRQLLGVLAPKMPDSHQSK